jgi:hypothetical protein
MADANRQTAEPATDLDRELSALASEWRAARGVSSSSRKAAMHPAYQMIIGKGTAAIPFLLRRLQEKPDHWFLALMAITGKDPVPKESQGKIKEMADAWVTWGKAEGYI